MYRMAKVKKITVEFEDGKKQVLEGEQADKYFKNSDANEISGFLMGRGFPAYDWKKEK